MMKLQKIVFELPVYTFQIDHNRHVSNIVYLEWMEIGRMKLLEAGGLPVHTIVERGLMPVLMETQITYRRPLYLGDRVRAEVWVSELTGASVWMEFRFYSGEGVLAATGRQRGVFVHAETLRPMRLTQEQRSAFEPYLHPAAEP